MKGASSRFNKANRVAFPQLVAEVATDLKAVADQLGRGDVRHSAEHIKFFSSFGTHIGKNAAAVLGFCQVYGSLVNGDMA